MDVYKHRCSKYKESSAALYTCDVCATLAGLCEFCHLLTRAGGVGGCAGVTLQGGGGGASCVALGLPRLDALCNTLSKRQDHVQYCCTGKAVI